MNLKMSGANNRHLNLAQFSSLDDGLFNKLDDVLKSELNTPAIIPSRSMVPELSSSILAIILLRSSLISLSSRGSHEALVGAIHCPLPLIQPLDRKLGRQGQELIEL